MKIMSDFMDFKVYIFSLEKKIEFLFHKLN